MEPETRPANVTSPAPSAQADSHPETAPLSENACQWFLIERKFCDKIKKEMRCDGNVKNCPF